MKEFDNDNEIIELDSNSDDITTIDNDNEGVNENTELKDADNLDIKKVSKKPKKSFGDKWSELDGKGKAFIIFLILILVVTLSVIIYLLFFAEFKPKDPEDDKEPVVIEKENYKYVDGSLVFLDKENNELGKYECTNKDDTRCMVAKVDNNTDTIERIIDVDSENFEIIKSMPIYNNKYVFIQDGDDKFLYDLSSKERLIELTKTKIYNTKDDYVVVQDTSGKYGLLKFAESYEYKIKSNYDYLAFVNPELNYLVAKEGNLSYIINIDGKKLSKGFSDNIQSVNKEFIVAKTGNLYSLYDYEYKELLSDYDYIGLNDEVISVAKGNRLYLYDTNLNKLNEDGLRLESTDNFVKINVYENNKLKEVKVAYSIDVKNNIAYITIGKDIKNINLLEGIISSNYELASYYDGKWYFYNDNSKQELIGVYTCINPNKLESTTDKPTNCYVYNKNDKYSGIYNNSYIFMYDNLTETDNNIYLYDFKTNKNRSTYSDLVIVNESELSDDIKPLYTSSSYIISKSATGNNIGNYGVLEIYSDGIRGKIDYKYKEIKKENKYYLITDLNNTQSIYNSDFEKISNEFDYIKLYDKYYAGVIGNKLNIYSYNNALGILESALNVTDNSFTIDFTDGFKITINGEEFNYDENGKLKEDNNTPEINEEGNTDNEE